jgi:hypothetical protein
MFAGAAAMVLVSGTATAAGGAVGGWRPAPSSQRSGATLAGTRHAGYAVNKRVCPAQPKPGTVTCYAMRRVAATRSTPRAYRAVTPANIGLGPAGGLTPDDLAVAYGYDPTTHRSSQTVGIVDWYDDPHISADLNTFDQNYGLPHETSRSFRKVNQKGKTSPLPSSTKGKQSAGEIALDVEAVRGVCHTCKILLVEASTPSGGDIGKAENTAVRMGATEVTNSFGAPEINESSKFLAAFNHPGVVITASTGDDGWFGWDFGNNVGGHSQNAASFPATDPTVIAVGGTLLGLNNDATIFEQVVWNENGVEDGSGASAGSALGATGGGCSDRYRAPTWQKHFPGYTSARCGGKRLAADVSVDADPQSGYDVYDTWGNGDSGWVTIGGTSLSSPVVAAMYALAGGSGGAAYPGASIYVNAALHPAMVYDVIDTIGSDGYASGNSFCGGSTPSNCGYDVYQVYLNHNPNAIGAGTVDCSFPHDNSDPSSPPAESSECNAAPGFDGPSGVGTPLSSDLFKTTSPAVSLKTPKHVRRHHKATFRATATERFSGAHITSYAFYWGDGHRTTGTSKKATHTYKRSGTYSVLLAVSDSVGQLSVANAVVKVSRH